MTDCIVTTRLVDMDHDHPAQDVSRVCGDCGERVCLSPSGQAVIRRDPTIVILCNVCSTGLRWDGAAPGALEEGAESYDQPKPKDVN